MKVCLDDECPVHTYMQRDPVPGCPSCEKPGSIVPCPECLGTGLRAVPGRDRTLICSGCDYEIDLDEEAPAFLGWVEKMTEQANLKRWGRPNEMPHRVEDGFKTTPKGSVQWHLEAARDALFHASPHDLEEFGPEDDLFIWLFQGSLRNAPVDSEAVVRKAGVES